MVAASIRRLPDVRDELVNLGTGRVVNATASAAAAARDRADGGEAPMSKRVRRPSPAMVVACLALFLAGTGTGAAVIKALPKNSVGTAQLKNNAVVSSKIKNGSLKTIDFAVGQLPKGDAGPTGPPGEKGEKGENGEKGDKGDPGANAATKIAVHFLNGPTVQQGGTTQAIAHCNAGERVVSGGSSLSGVTNGAVLIYDGPNLEANGWTAAFRNTNPVKFEGFSVRAYVVCVSP